jgi:hypothetical protein
MLKRYEDKARCPEGHTFTVRRSVGTAGKTVTTFCPDCGYSHRIKANYPPGVTPPPKGPTKESQIEHRLVQRVKELGGEVRKVKWIGRAGAPDRLVMLPPTFDRALVSKLFEVPVELLEERPGRTIWVELNAPGRKPSAVQEREHKRMRAMGQRVEVVDSYEGIEEILK